jgi:uncharacterized membrane protein (DUF485 family)
MKRSGHELLASPEFKRLVRRKWAVSILLTVLLFAMYYGYILLVAWDKPSLAKPVLAGGVTTRGILLGVGVILGAWVLTAIYVVWANRVYDSAVAELKSQLIHGDDKPTAGGGG